MNLHLISFDVPYPPNYGGIIVVYYHLKALQALGVKVTLHCFHYDNNPKTEKLDELCEAVYFYKRKKRKNKLLSSKPFIVNTRMPKELLENLLKDDAPIFFEGIHTTGHINNPALQDRVKIVRMHNIEWKYYESLKQLDVDNWHRLFFHWESKKLKKYEAKIADAVDLIQCLSPLDKKYYDEIYDNVAYIPVFQPYGKVKSQEGKGDYALFHGKLSVPDNEKAVVFLIDEVFSKYKYPFKVAGLDASDFLKEKIKQSAHIELIENPSGSQMGELIANAHTNILWSFQNNGLKLKLLHALFKGRHCLVNKDMIADQLELDQLCHIANDAKAMIANLKALKAKEITQEIIQKREKILSKGFNNEENARKSLDLIKKLKK